MRYISFEKLAEMAREGRLRDAEFTLGNTTFRGPVARISRSDFSYSIICHWTATRRSPADDWTAREWGSVLVTDLHIPEVNEAGIIHLRTANADVEVKIFPDTHRGGALDPATVLGIKGEDIRLQNERDRFRALPTP